MLDHLVLHEHKNPQCDACLRGRMSTTSMCRSKGRRLDPDLEQQKQKPTAYGQLLSGDHVIVSEKNEGQGGERTALSCP